MSSNVTPFEPQADVDHDGGCPQPDPLGRVLIFLRRKMAELRALWAVRDESFEDLAGRIDRMLDAADVETDRLLELGARKRAELQAQIDFLLRQAREADATIEARSAVAAQQDKLREIVRQVRQAARDRVPSGRA